ncbi:replication-relaxation family protein [Streptomyces aquilus]|uniref:replication-relaxation family protein n=1 Tax=Streptomyces aquilus TaxID=2548456 RepID=UPI001FCCA9ED|nr:replication-relaxation family protein [Streptomyces aquilus]
MTLPQAGRMRAWFVTEYGAEVVGGFAELRGWRPSRLGADRTAVRLRAGHVLTVTETALAFVQDACRCGDVCRPLDWIPEVHHPLGGGEAVIPDALLYYRRGGEGERDWSMLRAFVEVDRATMRPERVAAKIRAYERLYRYVPTPVGRPRGSAVLEEEWRRYPLFPRLLFVLDGTGPAGVENRLSALRAAARLAGADFARQVPILAAPLTELLRAGPSAPVWQPMTEAGQCVPGLRPWQADRLPRAGFGAASTGRQARPWA